MARITPSIDRMRVVTTAQKMVILTVLPPSLFFLRLAVPEAMVTKETTKNRRAATPVRKEVAADIIFNRGVEEEKV